MALTVDSALQAGQIAQAIQAIQTQIATLQQAIATSVTINAINVLTQIPGGGTASMQASLPMNLADSQTIFNSVLSLYQTQLTNLQNQLAAIV